MISVVVELTDHFNWGKFMISSFDEREWALRSKVDGGRMLAGRGWSPRHLQIFDLQTGEGALFLPGGRATSDLEKHRIWCCPMFEVFLKWLYDHPDHCADILTLPPIIELDPSQTRGHNALYGYRRPGPSRELVDEKLRETEMKKSQRSKR